MSRLSIRKMVGAFSYAILFVDCIHTNAYLLNMSTTSSIIKRNSSDVHPNVASRGDQLLVGVE